ncbi:hypothetical protein [Priestia koreensis]|uniref:hypothetical protein n=1 Tax=Priestia koreensis TaxID=284581 RepID=UPI00301ADD96
MKGKVMSILAFSIFLAGCGGDAVSQEANKAEKVAAKKQSNEKKSDMNEDKAIEAFYEVRKRPMDEVNKEAATDEVQTKDPKAYKIVPADHYTNAMDFQYFVGEYLQNFYNGTISDKDMLKFYQNYGSKDRKEFIFSNEANSKKIFHTIVKERKKAKQIVESYVLTDLEFDDTGNEAYFYRKQITEDGKEIYNVTTIRKEGSYWTFDMDEPSPAFIEKEETK